MKLEDFHKIDNQIDSCTFLYEDIDISYIARSHFIGLLRAKNNMGNKPIKISKSLVFRLIKGFLKTFFNLFRSKKYWVFSNAERRKKIDNYYYDRVASVVSENKNSVLFIENPVLVDHKKPSKDIILSDAVFYFFSLIFSKIYFNKKKLKIDDRFYKLSTEYHIQTNIEPLVKRFIGQYKAMSFYLRFFSKPELVFSVYPGGYLGYNYAFKENKIPIIELQHGIIYPLHPSYNSSLTKKSELFRPDYVFTYGKRDKECVESLEYVKKDKAFVVGSYGLQKIKDSSKEAIGDYLKKATGTSQKIITIVATTNDIVELYNFSLDLEKISNQKLKILLLPRHEINSLNDSENVKVLDVHKTNIFEIYKVSDFLLTKSSTAALEAMFMGMPVFIYQPNGQLSVFKKNYSYLNSLNYTESPAELIADITEGRYQLPNSEEVSNIYAKDVYSNFDNSIKKIEDEIK